jgi:hypothetical protein
LRQTFRNDNRGISLEAITQGDETMEEISADVSPEMGFLEVGGQETIQTKPLVLLVKEGGPAGPVALAKILSPVIESPTPSHASDGMTFTVA